MTKDVVNEFRNALESLDRIQVERVFDAALATASPVELVERLVVPALTQIGQAWHEGTLALSQVYMSGRLCEALIDRVLPPENATGSEPTKTAIVVLNDYHLLGKRIVHSVLRASGFHVLDYGRLDVEGLVDRVRADGIQTLLISTLMLPSALKVREVRDALGPELRIIVGGAPFLFDAELWREVGADAMGRTASDAIRLLQAGKGGGQ